MHYQRGDIVELNLPMPPVGKFMNHPFIIISNEDVYLDDNCYIAVMMTSTPQNDRYSYKIEDYMFVGKNYRQHSEARCHLVTFVLERDIVPNSNRAKIKKAYVDEIVDQMRIVALS